MATWLLESIALSPATGVNAHFLLPLLPQIQGTWEGRAHFVSPFVSMCPLYLQYHSFKTGSECNVLCRTRTVKTGAKTWKLSIAELPGKRFLASQVLLHVTARFMAAIPFVVRYMLFCTVLLLCSVRRKEKVTLMTYFLYTPSTFLKQKEMKLPSAPFSSGLLLTEMPFTLLSQCDSVFFPTSNI